jgi:molybdate transport system substrate-binding protein
MSTRSALVSRKTIIILAATLLLPLPSWAGDLLIFAAASTSEIVTAAIAGYKEGPVRASYASSGALARQIDSGAPADIYLSANQKWVDWLEKRGRIKRSQRASLLGNQLVMIAPTGTKLNLKIGPGFPLATALGDGRLAIADPAHVPAGQYAQQALKNLGVWDELSRRAARAPNVRAVLALVERGEAAAGIVYRTDAIRSIRVRMVDSFPADSHARIVYTLALIAPGTDKAAQALFVYLKSSRVQSIYRRFGFEALVQ